MKEFITTLRNKIYDAIVEDMNETDSLCNGFMDNLVEAYNFYCDENNSGWDKLLTISKKEDLKELIDFGANINQLSVWHKDGALYVIPSLYGEETTFTMVTDVKKLRKCIISKLNEIIGEVICQPNCDYYKPIYMRYISNPMAEILF